MEEKANKNMRKFPGTGSHNLPALKGLSSAQQNKWKEGAAHQCIITVKFWNTGHFL